MKYAVLFFIMLILVSACGNGGGKPSQEKVAKVYVDLLIVKERYGSLTDSLDIHTANVFTKHGISEEEYLKTLASYKADEEKWDSLFSKANGYLDSLNLNAQFE